MSDWRNKSWQQLLDQARSPAQIEAFSVEAFLERLGAEVAELGEGPEARAACDARLRAALAATDAFASQLMRIRLDYLAADHAPLERPFRKYLASRVLDYAGDLLRLRSRVAEAAGRVDPDAAANTAAAVTEAADQVLVLHARLREGILSLVPPEQPEEPPEEPRTPTRGELIEYD